MADQDNSSLVCKIDIPKVNGLEDQQLTVGRHFYLNCKGTWDKSFDFTKAQFVLDEATQNTLKVLHVEARDISSFDVDMAAYQAGEITAPQLVLSDGTQQLHLGQQKFVITSVLQKPDPAKPEPPKPFGFAIGQLHWPMAYPLFVAVIIFVILIQFLVLAFRKKRWKQLSSHVKELESPIAPDQQFYKQLRTLEKSDYPLAELEKAAKVYILRKFQVPLFDLSLNDTIKFIKNKYPRLKELRRSIYNLMRDLELLNKKENDTDFIKQKLKFIQQFYLFIEKCEDEKTKSQLIGGQE